MANSVKPEANPVVATRKQEVVIEDNQSIQNVEVFYEKNKRNINIAGIAIVLIIGGYLAYNYLYLAPKEAKAANKSFYAEQYFASDSLDKALNGDGQHYGFLKVIKEFGGTKTANLAHYYAGVSYMKQGDTKNAIKHLEDFNGNGTFVGTAAYGLLGNAYLESGNTSKGIDNLKKATENANDVVQTPMYLFNLGAAYEMAKKPEDAKKAYERIRDEFPTSMQARDIDRYLARLGDID